MEVLRLGSKGLNVKSVQERLKHLSFYFDHVDGEFDDATEAAVKRFQQDNGLESDGIVGPRTRAALVALRRGDGGPEVRKLQKTLTKKRKELQEKEQELKEKQQVLEKRRRALDQRREALEAKQKEPTEEQQKELTDTETELTETRQARQETQKALKEWPSDLGNEKNFGEETKAAVRAFQDYQGLVVTGTADPRTRAALGVATDAEEWEDVLIEELRIVNKRRGCKDREDTGLVGLAFSGGGIRSATFGLGVLEGMKALDLLDKIHYLSTVSGGGYIGSWLSANCRRAKDRSDPDWLGKETNWDNSTAHLRRYSKYLSPDVGFFSADTWSMVAIWMRNTLLVQLTVIFAVALVLLLPRPLFAIFEFWPDAGDLRWLTVVIFIVAVAGIAGNQKRLTGKGRIAALRVESWVLGLLAGVAFLVLALVAYKYFDLRPFAYSEGDNRTVLGMLLVAFALVWGGFFLMPVIMRLINAVSGLLRHKDVPQEVDYTQSGVQVAVVIPMLVTCYLVAAVLWGQVGGANAPLKGIYTYGGFLEKEWRWWPLPLQIALASLWVLSACSLRAAESVRGRLYDRFIALIAPLPALLVLYLLICAIAVLMHGWAANWERGAWLAFVWGPPLVLFAFILSIVVLIGSLGRVSTESAREWWSRLGAWLAIYGVAWMVVAVSAVYGPLWAAFLLGGEFWANLTAVGGWLITTAAGLLLGNSSSTDGMPGSEAQKSNSDKAKEWIVMIAPFVFIAGLLIGVSTCLHLIILNFSPYGDIWSFDDLHALHWGYMSVQAPEVPLIALGAALAGTLFLGWRVDINEFSLNAFYRSRLGRCYLGATRPNGRTPHNFTGFDEKDDLPLADLLKKDELAGPFHIVNCALNLGGSSDLALHTRHGASFTLTPIAAGSHYGPRDREGKRSRIGFRWIPGYGGRKDHPTLGQAVSVSGAAASPNMGYHTSPVVAFLLTMFNARLGWWFPNPRTGGNLPSPWFNLAYLAAELFGAADDKSGFLMLSDGGHFENLAAYELIKRRCRVIIVSDAECDPGLKFDGLGTLIRMCKVDFGVTINIKVGSIRRSAGAQWSSASCAVGEIRYPDAPHGHLIYLKASMTGYEDAAVLQYKAGHPTFPHESTGNQFYGEDQFESYRKLGMEIAHRTFEPMLREPTTDPVTGARIIPPPPEWDVGAKRLYQYFAPALKDAERFTQHSDRLMQLWSDLASNPQLRVFDNAFESSLKPTHSRSVFFMCSQMLQLMENVYLDLDLESTWNHPDNAGWRATFERWAKSPAIQRAWELSGATYGKRFQYFCERRLKFDLPSDASKGKS